MTSGGEVTAVVDVRSPESVDGVVDVTTEPSRDGWRIETSVFSVPWPDEFDIESPSDPSDRVRFYLLGDDGAAIFPQGPVPSERLPTPETLVAPGQRIVKQEIVDDIQVLEVAYEHDNEAWWQSHWMIPWTPGRTLVFTAQAPDRRIDSTRRAVERVACESLPYTRGA